MKLNEGWHFPSFSLKDIGEISHPLGLLNFPTLLSAREAMSPTKCLLQTREYFHLLI